MKPIYKRASFEFVRYGMVWEDADILCEALAPAAKTRRVLSIASAGDNVLALLTLNPKEIVAADLSAAQLACLDLRMAAFAHLSYESLLAFVGAAPDPSRLQTYRRLRRYLKPRSRAHWDRHSPAVSLGIIHAGKLEKFLARYRNVLRSWVHSEGDIGELLKPRPRRAREAYYSKAWNTRAWRLLNRMAFSRRILGMLGRDREFFRHAKDNVTHGPAQRLERALTELPVAGNPYLRYHLTGNYSEGALPLYLRKENFRAIRSGLSRIRLFQGPIEDAPGTYSAFNLSNIFEYMDAAGHLASYRRLAAKALPGARLAYWNLHVPRPCPAGSTRPLRALEQRLHSRDRYWAYRSFHVDEQTSQ